MGVAIWRFRAGSMSGGLGGSLRPGFLHASPRGMNAARPFMSAWNSDDWPTCGDNITNSTFILKTEIEKYYRGEFCFPSILG